MLFRHKSLNPLALITGSITFGLVLSAALAPAQQKPAVQNPAVQNPDEFWFTKVEPLLDKKCLKCHAGVRQQGGLDLRSLETILRGGDRGPAIIPGKPAESRILQFIVPKAAEHMPPDIKRQLTPEEIGILKSWVSMLPIPKSKLASGTSTNNTWVPEYLAEVKRQRESRELHPPKLAANATIDWFLQADWKRDKVEPAQLSGDSAFARRVYLDITGRIPTRTELGQFIVDTAKDKRERLVDKLIASDEYPRHMREIFDTVLMGRPNNKNLRERADKGWYAFLEDVFKSNRPWNQVVREMLIARPAEGPGRGAMWFIAEKNNSHQAIAESVAPVVFGMQIKCAQCHNHPLAWEIEQRHYWGLVATYNRSKNVNTETGLAVSESATGGFINFANLKKESQPATMVFLNGKSVPERIPGMDEKEVDSPALYVVPPSVDGKRSHGPAVPKFSRREVFADSVTKDNPLLARAFVNRMWGNLMGRGIVQPVDQIDSRHRASHPELLEWLAHDFEQNGYDIKKLVRNIVLSRAYQLDSRPVGKTVPRPESFARAVEKPLTGEQLLRSLCVATGNRSDASSRSEMERTFAATFPDLMPETYNPSLQQALFLTNSPILDDLLKAAPGNTTSKLAAIPSTQARVKEAFVTVLGRSPDPTELQQCQSMLAAQSPESGVKNLLWALLTCAEFKVNH